MPTRIADRSLWCMLRPSNHFAMLSDAPSKRGFEKHYGLCRPCTPRVAEGGLPLQPKALQKKVRLPLHKSLSYFLTCHFGACYGHQTILQCCPMHHQNVASRSTMAFVGHAPRTHKLCIMNSLFNGRHLPGCIFESHFAIMEVPLHRRGGPSTRPLDELNLTRGLKQSRSTSDAKRM